MNKVIILIPPKRKSCKIKNQLTLLEVFSYLKKHDSKFLLYVKSKNIV